MMQAYGAELILTDSLEGTDGAQRYVRDLVRREPDPYFYPDQYNNDANWQAHFETTGKEILEQTGGQVTHFVAALGTTGTFMGVTRRLKRYDPSICSFGPVSQLVPAWSTSVPPSRVGKSTQIDGSSVSL